MLPTPWPGLSVSSSVARWVLELSLSVHNQCTFGSFGVSWNFRVFDFLKYLKLMEFFEFLEFSFSIYSVFGSLEVAGGRSVDKKLKGGEKATESIELHHKKHGLS